LLALAGTGIAKALFEAKPKNVAHLAPAVSADTLVALLGRLQRWGPHCHTSISNLGTPCHRPFCRRRARWPLFVMQRWKSWRSVAGEANLAA